jgi:hypothetical protein
LLGHDLDGATDEQDGDDEEEDGNFHGDFLVLWNVVLG